MERGGKVIVPAFAVGRTQELVYNLNEMMQNGDVPRVPVFVDSPLAVNATKVFKAHPECFDEETRKFVMESRHPALDFNMLTYVNSVDESKALNERKDPMVIISASGMAAVMLMLFSLLKSGDHVVFSQSMFGSTIKLIGTEFARFGVDSTIVPQTDLDAWRQAIRPKTRLLFAETPTNPLTDVCDIAALAEMAHAHGAWLAVDNCFATPVLQRPLAMGADIVMHSGTKYLDGQGRVMAGALCAPEAMVRERFLPVIKNAGMVLSPFNAWVVLKGLSLIHI